MKMKKNGACVRLNVFGLKYIQPLQDLELERGEKLLDFLTVKQRHKEVTVRDALKVSGMVGLKEKISEGFQEIVQREKRGALGGIVASLAIPLVLHNTDLPQAIDPVGYVLSLIGGVANIAKYTRAYLANLYVQGNL
ncbi:hypothetical protein K8R33_04160 [archaeon]|nr:hypothetical protein [archaeon]